MLKGKRSVTPSRGASSADQSHRKSMDTTVQHWNDIVQETVLYATNPDTLYFTLSGGADEGRFPHIEEFTAQPEDVEVGVRGHGLNLGDVLLEIQGQKISGYTGQDVQETLQQCLSNGKMVVVRAIPKGKKDYFQVLSLCITKSFVSFRTDSSWLFLLWTPH